MKLHLCGEVLALRNLDGDLRQMALIGDETEPGQSNLRLEHLFVLLFADVELELVLQLVPVEQALETAVDGVAGDRDRRIEI